MGHQAAQHGERLVPSQDVLLHVPRDPLVHEALHVHVPNGICHILVEVHLVKLQAMAQEVVHHAGEQRHLWQREDVHELLDGGALAIEAAHLVEGDVLGAPIELDHLFVWHRLEAPVSGPQLHVMEGVNLHQKALLNVVVQAADGEAGVVVIPPNALWVLVALDQEVAGGVEDLRVQRVRVLGQRVVVVEAVDLDVAQADLVVGVDGRGVQQTADLGRQEV